MAIPDYDEELRSIGLVIEKANEVERLLDEIIFAQINPNASGQNFVLGNLLHNSIISFAGKVKLVLYINKKHNLGELNRENLHKLLNLRNAFAHNDMWDKFDVHEPEDENSDKELYIYMESMVGNGSIKRIRRDHAHSEVDVLYKSLKKQLESNLEALNEKINI